MESLKKQPIWACWRGDKKPRNPLTGELATSTDETTWCSYEDCYTAVADGDYDGYGIMCNNDLVFIDIDNCLWETPNGDLMYNDTPEGYIPAREVVHRFAGTYMEVSKSGTGIHIICYGNVPLDKTGVRSKGVELYKAARFLIITEDILNDEVVVTSKQESLEWLLEAIYLPVTGENLPQGQIPYGKCSDRENAFKKAMTDEAFRNYYCGVRPYEDESRNDHGFITKLCFYFNRDPEVCYDVLMKSPYFTTKDKAHQEKMERRFDSYFLPTFNQVSVTTPTVWGETVEVKSKEIPRWLIETDKGYQIDEVSFLEDFMSDKELHYINDVFYDEKANILREEVIKQTIQNSVAEHFSSGLARKTDALFKAIQNYYYEEQPPHIENVIHAANCDIVVNKTGLSTVEGGFNLRRLPVDYDETATCPRWEQFINELFYPEDIPLVQEYLGYCLVPTTKAQTALFILGNGGEGKSRVTAVMSQLLGNKAVSINVAEIQNDRFFAAQAENALCLIDDDASIDKIEKTEVFKKLVTADTPMSIEQKYQPKRSAIIYARLLVCSNAVFSSKFDRSDGFYRRLKQVKVRPLDEQNRMTDRYLGEKLSAELSGILNWCVKGLLRLQQQSYEFTTSWRVEEIEQENKIESNSFIAFIHDAGYVEYGSLYVTSGKDLYKAYVSWCEDGGYTAVKHNTAIKWLKTNSKRLGVKYTENVIRNGKRCRGFIGIRLIEDNYSPVIELVDT